MKHKDWYILGLITFFGFILRIWQLGKATLWIDEEISALAAQGIVNHGFPIFDSGIFYSRALLFHYLQAFFLEFSHSSFALRLPSVIAGTILIALVYFIGKEFDKPTAIISSLLTAVFYLEIVYSRQARFYQLLQLFFFLSIYLLYKSKESKRYSWFAVLSIFLAVQTHIESLVLIPLCLFVFWKDHKDWKLLVIPILIGVYYSSSFFSVGATGTSLAGSYVESYASEVLNYLRVFAFISLFGLYFMWKSNKRLLLLIVVPSLLILIGLPFIKLFAIRYIYIIIPTIILGASALISALYRQTPLFGIILVLVCLIYPSNLIFSHGYLTVIQPIALQPYTNTEPVIEYPLISQSAMELIDNNDLVVLWSPGAAWYIRNPDYVIPFSLNGASTGYAIKNNRDVYTGAPAFIGQTAHYVLLEDYFGYVKLNSTEREDYEQRKQYCSLLEQDRTFRIYSCGL